MQQLDDDIEITKSSQSSVWATVCALELGIVESVISPSKNLPIKSSCTESTLDKTLELDRNDLIVIHHDHGYAFPAPRTIRELSSSRVNSALGDDTSVRNSEPNVIRQKTKTIKEIMKRSQKRPCNREKKSYTSKEIKRARFEIKKSKNLESTKENRDNGRPRRDFIGRRVNVRCASIKKNLTKNFKKSSKPISRTKQATIANQNVTKNDCEHSDIGEPLHARITNTNGTKNDYEDSEIEEPLHARIVNKNGTNSDYEDSNIQEPLHARIANTNGTKNDYEDCDLEEPLHARTANNNCSNSDYEDSDLEEPLHAKTAKNNCSNSDYEDSDLEEPLHTRIANKNGTNSDYEYSDIEEPSHARFANKNGTDNDHEDSNIEEPSHARLANKNGTDNDYEDSNIEEPLHARIANTNGTKNDYEDCELEEPLHARTANKNGTKNDYENPDLEEPLHARIANNNCSNSDYEDSEIEEPLHARVVNKNGTNSDYEDSNIEEPLHARIANTNGTKNDYENPDLEEPLHARTANNNCSNSDYEDSDLEELLHAKTAKNNCSNSDYEDSDLEEPLHTRIANKNGTNSDYEYSDIEEPLHGRIANKNGNKKDYEDSDIDEPVHATIANKNGTKHNYKDSDVDEKRHVLRVTAQAQLKFQISKNLEPTKENRIITPLPVIEHRASIKRKLSQNFTKMRKAISIITEAKIAKKNVASNDYEESDESLLAKIDKKYGMKNDCEYSQMGETSNVISKTTHQARHEIEQSKNLESMMENLDTTQRVRSEIKKSENVESAMEKRDTTRSCQESISPSVHEPPASIKKKPRTNSKRSRRAISRRNRAKVGKKHVEKNDYEDSDIDETLLVDPSRDLPRLILDTVFPDINLTSPEFNANLDLNFETDERLSSTLATLERDMLEKSATKFAETSTKSSRRCNEVPKIGTRAKIQKTVKFGNDSMMISRKSLTKKRRTADDDIVENEIMALIDLRKNNNEQNMIIDYEMGRATRQSARKLQEKRDSADGATIAIDNAISAAKNVTTKANDQGRQFPIGTLVWGNCQGWWPAIIVKDADVGKSSSPGTTWVYWIGDDRISNLRKNTEIKPFSKRFEGLVEFLRINEGGNSKLAIKKPKGMRYNVYIATLKLINEQILNNKPWTEPHDIWAEQNIMSLRNLDRLIFHPFPPEIRSRLDELKRANDGSEESSINNNISYSWSNSTSLENQEKDATEDARKLPLSCQQFGTIAWTKFEDEPWWPGIIVDYRDTDLKHPKFGKQMICRYGDFELSEVDSDSILKFDLNAERLADYDKNKQKYYRRAIVEAAQDFCSRYGYQTLNWTMSEIRDWFAKFHKFGIHTNFLPGISINSDKLLKYPARISEALKKQNGFYIVEVAREQSIRKSNRLTLAILEKRKINDICLMCLKNVATSKESIDHPFFCGKLCLECSKKYEPTIFACGDDGKGSFCTVCAGSDTLLICDETPCTRVYCMPCVKYIIAPEMFDDIVRTDPWRCFFCDKYSKTSIAKGALKIRDDWKQQISRLIRSNFRFVPTPSKNIKNQKTKIRVLSLFDGISAGYIALSRLGIEIDAYFSSEIEPNAEMISSANFGEKITRLGDVRGITATKLQEIGPIDLLIGGSPCNDLSIANPDRLGLNDPNGSGILFFEYMRIKEILESQNENANRLFFWLFENVASMPENCKIQIDRYLGREPRNINSANCSPQHRERLYWGNLPAVSFPVSSQDVQDILAPNRRSLVTKTRTVTTSRHSLMQGTKKVGRKKPILTNETSEGLQMNEVEKIFGFPKHYTDVGDLCATKRLKLIGKSWSVQTIVELFRPLAHFFDNQMDDSI